MTVVGLAPGQGTIARREQALLFAPGEASSVLGPFLDAADAAAARTAVTAALIEAGYEAEPFGLVTWDDGFQLLVFGALEVCTDLPELPMLSGAGSTTWVERRVSPVPDAVMVSAGGEATEGTDLTGGVVLAGGFRATITPEPATAPDPSAELHPSAERTDVVHSGARVATDADTDVVPRVSDDSGDSADTSGTEASVSSDAATDLNAGYTSPSEEVVADRADGLAALQAATGGDWMEDSLGLGGAPGVSDPDEHDPQAPDTPGPTSPSDAAVDDDHIDDEVTLGRDDVLPSGPMAPPAGSPLPPPTGDPLQPGFQPPDDSIDERAVVTARECPMGHLNDPHASQCRICSDAIGPGAPTVTVRQPVLGLLVAPDGTSYPIDSTMVLGRRPDTDAAKVDAGSRTIRIDTSSAVSRTHVVIRPEGWTITATDCGSRGGSVVINEAGSDPTMLQPWVPQETPIGSEVYLGGPTKIVIAKPGGPPPPGNALDTLEVPELPD